MKEQMNFYLIQVNELTAIGEKADLNVFKLKLEELVGNYTNLFLKCDDKTQKGGMQK